jgi:hypothetical protein
LNDKTCFYDLYIDDRIILKWILNKYGECGCGPDSFICEWGQVIGSCELGNESNYSLNGGVFWGRLFLSRSIVW